jgi:hypothetical protein
MAGTNNPRSDGSKLLSNRVGGGGGGGHLNHPPQVFRHVHWVAVSLRKVAQVVAPDVEASHAVPVTGHQTPFSHKAQLESEASLALPHVEKQGSNPETHLVKPQDSRMQA